MNVPEITSTVPWPVPSSQSGDEAVMFVLQHDGGSVIIGDEMDDMDRLYHIGGGRYLKRGDNGFYDADGHITGCFTVGIDPDHPEPPTHEEMVKIAARHEWYWNTAPPPRDYPPIPERSTVIAENRSRFFHR